MSAWKALRTTAREWWLSCLFAAVVLTGLIAPLDPLRFGLLVLAIALLQWLMCRDIGIGLWGWLLSLLLTTIVACVILLPGTAINIGSLVVAGVLWIVAVCLAARDPRAAYGRPVNYMALEIEAEAILYTDLTSQALRIPFADILHLRYVREEAMFDDLFGPYDEEKWVISTAQKRYIEVMDEPPHRARLIDAFKQHLPGFDEKALTAALATKTQGEWTLYGTLPPPVLSHENTEPE